MGTCSRPKFYLIDQVETSFEVSKLPKGSSVLSVFLSNLQTKEKPEAARMTSLELKSIWEFHFGYSLIMGVDPLTREIAQKIIIEDNHIIAKVLDLWKQWSYLETTSRRPDRSSKDSFKEKEKQFIYSQLDMPFNISRKNHAEIFKNDSGMGCIDKGVFMVS